MLLHNSFKTVKSNPLPFGQVTTNKPFGFKNCLHCLIKSSGENKCSITSKFTTTSNFSFSLNDTFSTGDSIVSIFLSLHVCAKPGVGSMATILLKIFLEATSWQKVPYAAPTSKIESVVTLYFLQNSNNVSTLGLNIFSLLAFSDAGKMYLSQ